MTIRFKVDNNFVCGNYLYRWLVIYDRRMTCGPETIYAACDKRFRSRNKSEKSYSLAVETFFKPVILRKN